MGAKTDNWIGGITEALVPGFGNAQDRNRTDEAAAGQVKAGEGARGYLKTNLEYQKRLNEPLIQMGDQQLRALKQGVEEGAFGTDEGLFRDYQQYIAPEYEPGGKFQYEPRQNLMTPERFQYAQANPEAFQYNQQAPAPFTYNQQQQPTGNQGQQSQVQNGDNQQPGMAGQQSNQQQQYDERYARTLNGEQLNEYNQSIFSPTPQQQQQQQSAQQSNFNQQAPGQMQYQNFQDNTQAPQFNPIQNQNANQPQFYQSGNAPQAQYVQPQQQYQGKQFNLQDDPVYQKRLADSNKAIEASAAARGMQLSGSNLKALQQNASDLAATEGDAAFNRFQQQDQTEYNRFQDQRADLKDTTRYQTEDEYRRYLDTQNIKGAEADKAVAQWNTDRSFNQGANVQNFQTAQDAYSNNRGQNADIYNMNAGNQLAYGAQNQNQYNQNFNNAMNAQNQNFNQYNQNYQNAANTNQQNFNQFNTNRNYATSEDQRSLDNLINAYNTNNTNYTTDRAFDYGANQDYNQNQFDALQYNVGNSQLENANQYGLLTDAYNRQDTQKKNKYGMISDLANVGMTGRQNIADATSGYYGSMADIGIQQANAKAAAAADKNSNNGILSWLGL
ncbi:MAG: hypothetical protein PHN44_01325 [Candidatus Marinimicrobia bacterium]|nr:hypothetical protein [Candidatus Neomarinimicrobiota bacterium]